MCIADLDQVHGLPNRHVIQERRLLRGSEAGQYLLSIIADALNANIKALQGVTRYRFLVGSIAINIAH